MTRINGKLEGLYEEFHPNRKIKYQHNYKSNIKDGLCKDFYNNGQLESQGHYKDGKLTGIWEIYNEEGQLIWKGDVTEKFYEDGFLKCEGNVKNEKKHGLWKFYRGFESSEVDWFDIQLSKFRKRSISSTGYFKNDKKHGTWKFYDDKHNVHFVTNIMTYKNGVLEGPVEEFCEYTGQLKLKGSYKKGLRDGIHYEYESNRNFDPWEVDELTGGYYCSKDNWEYKNLLLKSKGNYKNNKKNGLWETFNSDGLPEGIENYVQGVLEGNSIFFDDKGHISFREFYKDGEMVGLREYYSPQDYSEDGLDNYLDVSEEEISEMISKNDGDISNHKYPDIGKLKNKKKHGQWKSFFSQGEIKSIQKYKNGLREGTCQMFDIEGNLITKGKYKNDKREGLWEDYSGNFWSLNSIEKGNYKLDKKDGVWESFHDDELSSRDTYVEGVLEGISESFYDGGEVCYQCHYKEGRVNGLYESFYSNGQLKQKGEYKSGLKNGLWEGYFENGGLEIKVNFMNDEVVGPTECYNIKGEVITFDLMMTWELGFSEPF